METITFKLPEIDEVEFLLIGHEEHEHPEDFIATGDDECDKQYVKEILEEMEHNPYAWFIAEVKASWKGIESESEYLGGCSCESKQDFIDNSGYYNSMKESAYNNLIHKLQELESKNELSY